MKTRKLGAAGPELTEIGLGTWAIGGSWQFGWGPSDNAESIKTIQRALDLGINWIDTAAAYGLGHSEEIVGKAVKDRRQDIYIATKCGLRWNEKGKVHNNLSPDSIRKEVEDSLKRLQTDVIDLYQIHWPDPSRSTEKAWREMSTLQKEGKVRWIGVSNFNVKQMETCEAIQHIDSLQPPYSILEPDAEKDLFPFCRKKDIGVVAYSPMASGLLTGSFEKSKLAKDDWRQRDPRFQEPRLSRVLSLVEELRTIAQKYQKTVAQLAIAWVLRHPAVTSAIVGARRVDQVEQNVGGAGWTLEQQDISRIDELMAELL